MLPLEAGLINAYHRAVLVPPQSTFTWLQFGTETSWRKGVLKSHADGRLVDFGYNQYAAEIT
jgi:hypothetical protein